MFNLNREFTLVIACSDNERLHFLEEKVAKLSNTMRIKIVSLTSGNAVLDAFEKFHPDLFIIDIDLKGVKVSEVCRWIRANEGERHTGIMMTSLEKGDVNKVSAEFLNFGADDCMLGSFSGEELQTRICSLMRFKLMMDDLRKSNFTLKKMILADELTGLANMRGFKKQFRELVHQCQSNETGICVIMLDIDHFKQVNDQNNHLIGSKILAKTGNLLKQALKQHANSVIARYGGDEFVLCVALNSESEANLLAEKVRQAFVNYLFITEGIKLNLTVSVGVSWVEPGFNGPAQDILKLADIMLYRSKALGRNQVNMMRLRYPIDFDHVSRMHTIKGNAGSDNDEVSRVYNA